MRRIKRYIAWKIALSSWAIGERFIKVGDYFEDVAWCERGER